METRANSVFVTVVVVILLGLLAGFVAWIAAGRDPGGSTYEIRFRQSVSGLRDGSPVTLSGVKVGVVDRLAIDDGDPGVVKVRIEIQDDVPLGAGVSASVSTSLLGDAAIILEGARRGAPALARNADGVALIPVRDKPMGGGGGGAAGTFNQVWKITTELNDKLDEPGRNRIEAGLRVAERDTRGWVEASRKWSRDLGGVEAAVTGAGRSLGEYQGKADRLADRLDRLQGDGPGSLDARLRRARESTDEARAGLRNARPGIRSLAAEQVRATEQLEGVGRKVRNARETVEQIDQNGIGQRKLPDYKEGRP